MGTAVLGAGPAGLTAAYVLAIRGVPGVVYEADGTVGGIAKTVEYNGYRFDLGGHRFFTKLKPVQRLWEEIMGDDFLTRPAAVAHLLQGQVLLLPADREGRRGAARARRVGALRALVLLEPAEPRPRARRDLRGLGDGPLRPAALRRLLPLLHGEGLGDPGLGDPVGVGGAADQELLALARAADDPRAAAQARHDPDRGVPLPAARPGPDVGALPASASRSGIPVQLNHRCDVDPPRARARTSIVVRDERPGDRARRRRRAVEHPAQRADPPPRPAAAGRHPRGGAARCATATSASSR